MSIIERRLLGLSVARANGTFSAVLPDTVSSITKDGDGNVTGWTESGVAYTATYDSAGRVATVSNGTTTRTVSYDSDDNVTAVA